MSCRVLRVDFPPHPNPLPPRGEGIKMKLFPHRVGVEFVRPETDSMNRTSTLIQRLARRLPYSFVYIVKGVYNALPFFISYIS